MRRFPVIKNPQITVAFRSRKKVIKCPACDLRLPESDLSAQVKHMEEKHPEVITKRHVAVGIRSE